MDENHQLLEALKKVLTENGDLNYIRASLRLKIVEILREQDYQKPVVTSSEDSRSPKRLLDKLILEFLSFRGYESSRKMFGLEASVDPGNFERDELEQVVGSETEKELDDQKPVLLQLLENVVFKKTEIH